jgi:transcriptional regulator with XRE-family HTH domain
MFLKTFGARLREERERLGLSQTAFAESCGVKKLAQINYEKGERAPDVIYLHRASQAGADATYILTGDHQQPAAKPPDQDRLRAAIEIVESVDSSKHKPPQEKACAILLAYELLADHSIDLSKLVELLRRLS